MKYPESNRIEAISKEEPWLLVNLALAIVRPLAIAGILFSVVVMVGYFEKIEVLYRPISGGPATNPLTAVCIFLLAVGILGAQYKGQYIWFQRLFIILALAISSIRILDVILNSDIHTQIMPFQNQVMLDLQMGKSNSMGVNTALMLLIIAIALILNSFHLPMASQFASFIAVGIPTVSFTGYAYGLEHFYGEMCLITATLGFILAIASLAMTARIGALKSILSPYIGGRIARLQTFAGYIVPTVLGFLIIESMNISDGGPFGIFVVAVCWFNILMVSVSAIAQENIDQQRRSGELQLLQAAMNDPLTNLSNRRKFYDFGQHEIEHAERAKTQPWVMIIDLDHFKRVNDTAGHAMGDQVLIEVSKVLKKSIRSVDLVSRIGGEEFAVLLVDSNREGTAHVAEKIRENIENISITGWTDLYEPVTASIGCAQVNSHRSLDSTLNVADESLYRAKQNGRNQVSFEV